MTIHRLEHLRGIIAGQGQSAPLARHNNINAELSPTPQLSQPASKVSLNQTGQHFLISSENDIDKEKIDTIRQAISSGIFVIDPYTIAQRMVADIFERPY